MHRAVADGGLGAQANSGTAVRVAMDDGYCLAAFFVFISVLFHMLISVLLYSAYGAADAHILTYQ